VSNRVVRRSWRPVVAVVTSALLAIGTLLVDRMVGLAWDDEISKSGARTFLATVAGTMITATVVVFWIRGLLVSTRAGSVPIRVLSSYLDDPDQQWLMGATVGIFVFASTVLFAVPVGDTGSVPTMSIAVTGLGTVAALVGIIYSISSGSDAMHEQRILRRIVDTTLSAIERRYPDGQSAGAVPPEKSAANETVIVRSTRFGWLRSVHDEQLLDELPDGSQCRRIVAVGSFVHPGERLCELAVDGPKPDLADRVEAAFELGDTRTTDDDISFGIRNLVDIALDGMADGADRTTGREAIEHLEAVLRPLVVREGPPPAYRDDHGRWMIRSPNHDFEAYIDDVLEDLHDAAADARTRRLLDATVLDLIDAAEATGRHDRARVLRRYACDDPSTRDTSA
jgi:uncharacterized membrane protein